MPELPQLDTDPTGTPTPLLSSSSKRDLSEYTISRPIPYGLHALVPAYFTYSEARFYVITTRAYSAQLHLLDRPLQKVLCKRMI